MGTASRGPAAYFPAIEKAHRRPVAHGFAVLDGAEPGLSHMQQVALLESAHGLGHGHANAPVAGCRARR